MTIAEVAARFEVTADTLRYYERTGLIPDVPRTAGGIRNYDEETCNWIAHVKCMRMAGVSIDALAEYCRLYQQGDSTISRRKDLLKEECVKIEKRIEEMQNSLDILKYKICRYEIADKTGILTWE